MQDISQLPSTSSQLPSTSASPVPSTSSQLPSTSASPVPSTSSQLPSTSSQLPSTSCQLPSISISQPPSKSTSQLPSKTVRDEPSVSYSAKIDNSKLMYIGHNITRIPEVFWKIHGPTIEHLDLSYNIIHNLIGLEHFALLTDLILDNNSLGDSLEFPTLMPRLKTLSLNKNRINDLTGFIRKVKRSCPNLEFLSLLGNRACPNELSDMTKDEADYQRYRYYVLHHLRTLKFLDSAPVTKQELQEAIRRGQFMQTKKPKPYSQLEQPNFLTEENFRCTPLPPSGKSVGDHKGAYTTYKSRYTNRESEGNRFIVNSDL